MMHDQPSHDGKVKHNLNSLPFALPKALLLIRNALYGKGVK